MGKQKGNANTNRQIDKHWQKIFEDYSILEYINKQEVFEITAEQIKKYKEPRLMTKFDYINSLPNIFKENQLSILPVTRGSYIIGKFNAYQNLDGKKTTIKKMNFPDWIEGLDYKNLYSEASAINCAYVSGIINDVINDDKVFMTLSGRMGTGEFDYKINSSFGKDYKVNVSKAQCEIDGAFESRNQLLLLEAKNNVFEDFIVRQLYYPYRAIKSTVKKNIIPAFLTYSNNIFSFYLYEVKDINHYNSLELKELKRYIIDDFNINVEDIKRIVYTVPIVNEPDIIPFPQADTMENVVNLMSKLYEESDYFSKENITLEFGFDRRQADYYANAGAYLSFINIQRGKATVTLSSKGKQALEMRSTQKYLTIFEAILAHKVFNEVMKIYLKTGVPPIKAEIVKIMKQCNLKNMNTEKMYGRRASTVASWINWILEIVSSS